MNRLPDWLQLEWRAILMPTQPLLEILLRGTLSYIGLFLIMRYIMRRQTGAMSVADLLVIVIIADASQNAMAGDGKSLSDGLLLVLTIVSWDWAIDWLGYHVPFLKHLTNPPARLLVKDGAILPRQLAAEKLSLEELTSMLRAHGVKGLGEVERAYIEGDGRLSVLKFGDGDDGDDPDGQTADRSLG